MRARKKKEEKEKERERERERGPVELPGGNCVLTGRGVSFYLRPSVLDPNSPSPRISPPSTASAAVIVTFRSLRSTSSSLFAVTSLLQHWTLSVLPRRTVLASIYLAHRKEPLLFFCRIAAASDGIVRVILEYA